MLFINLCFLNLFKKHNIETKFNKRLVFLWFQILVVNTMMYVIASLFFEVKIIYEDILVNILFTFLFYIIFSNLFDYYQKLVFRGTTNA